MKGEQMGIDGDAVYYVETKDVRTNDYNASKLEGEEVEEVEVEIEEVGCEGKEGGGGGREEENSCSDCRIESNHIDSVIEGSVSSTPLPLLSSNKSSMPSILAVLRTHVHLNFPDLKCFHLIADEEILNAYGIEFTI